MVVLGYVKDGDGYRICTWWWLVLGFKFFCFVERRCLRNFKILNFDVWVLGEEREIELGCGYGGSVWLFYGIV